MADHKAKGLCYNYDEHFMPSHRCKILFFLEVPKIDDEVTMKERNPVENLEDHNELLPVPCISLRAI